jgi:glycerol-3-phosphate dehydrogenase (NAD(P)+)
MKKTAVIGAGSWGTALAKHAADIGHEVVLWSRREDHARAIRDTHSNAQYLPGITLPGNLTATSSLAEALGDAELVLSVVPSHTKREVWRQGRAFLRAGVPVMSASKGIENETLDLMSDVLHEELGSQPLAFLAGPSFAKEVAVHAPTSATTWWASRWAARSRTSSPSRRARATASASATTPARRSSPAASRRSRGSAMKMGGDPLTLAGLAGMGDLVLTCTGELSRNRHVGVELGQGRSLEEILGEMRQVAEGVRTAGAQAGPVRLTIHFTPKRSSHIPK